jgi:hypothetical protein
MSQQPTQVIRLAQGGMHHVPVTRGSIILVRYGRVILRPPPEWLAGNVVRPELRLDAEETYVAVAAGWTDLMAPGSAEVMLIAGQSNPLPLCRPLGRLLNWLLRRRPLPANRG